MLVIGGNVGRPPPRPPRAGEASCAAMTASQQTTRTASIESRFIPCSCDFISEVELKPEPHEPAREDRGRDLPVHSKRGVQRGHRIRVQQIVKIELRLHPNPPNSNVLDHAEVDL